MISKQPLLSCLCIATVFSVLIPTQDAEAIVRRDDRTDAQHTVNFSDWPQVIVLYEPDDCSGTLIHPEWLVTAAHCLVEKNGDLQSPGLAPGDNLKVNINGGTAYEIAEIIAHPSYDEDNYDVALIHFTQAVTGVTPLPIYEQRNELGKAIEIVGVGVTGTASKGEKGASADGHLHRATNTIDQVNSHYIRMTFNSHTDNATTNREGLGVSGDSGCGVFITVDGVRHVAGVNSYGAKGSGNGIGTYGSRDFHSRISSYKDWINSYVPYTGDGGSPPSLAVPSIDDIASAQTYTENMAISKLTFNNNGGGSLTNCSADSLPAGLSVSRSAGNSTCAITGTPTTNQVSTIHTITASNNTGSDTAEVTIRVNAALPAAPLVNNINTTQTYTVNTAIPNLTFVNNGGGSLTDCTADSMPAGLNVAVTGNGNTCRITGTPTATQSATTHTITAINASGSDAAEVTIRVNAALPAAPLIDDISQAQSYTVNTAIAPLSFTNYGGGSLTDCTADAMPEGLGVAVSGNGNTCRITGTPTATQSATMHTITATNAVSSDTATVSIAVKGSSGTWQEIDSENFKNGWGIWVDGGYNSRRQRDSWGSHSDSYSIELQGYSNSSKMTTKKLAVSAYNDLRVDFWFKADSMANGGEFSLQISTNGGSSWKNVKTWRKGNDFTNNRHYHKTVNISGQSLTSNTKLRFVLDASKNNDWIYIDDVIIDAR